ncbi:MAG TPA: hypothetical protein VN081_04895 [Dongiaceae bacterium]|nr:hypothetical protein [Dongiaceae bacterium]
MRYATFNPETLELGLTKEFTNVHELNGVARDSFLLDESDTRRFLELAQHHPEENNRFLYDATRHMLICMGRYDSEARYVDKLTEEYGSDFQNAVILLPPETVRGWSLQ